MSIEAYGYISELLFFLAYFPQLWRTYRLQSVDDISIWMWRLVACAQFTGLIYGFYIGSLPLLMGHSIGLWCSFLMMAMYYSYYDSNRDAARTIVRNMLKDIRKHK